MQYSRLSQVERSLNGTRPEWNDLPTRPIACFYMGKSLSKWNALKLER